MCVCVFKTFVLINCLIDSLPIIILILRVFTYSATFIEFLVHNMFSIFKFEPINISLVFSIGHRFISHILFSAWGYSTEKLNGEIVMGWADRQTCFCFTVQNRRHLFHSARWNTDTTPDLSFISTDGSVLCQQINSKIVITIIMHISNQLRICCRHR